jgi:hypothetical protein
MVCIRSKLTLDLTEDDWKIYLDTIKAAMTKKDSKTGKTLWETANEKHAQVSALHSKDWFTYLHRYFLVWFERQLQEINPKFAFFYWATTHENAGWPKSKIWEKLGGCKDRVKIKDLGDYEVRRNCQTSIIFHSIEYYASLYNETKGQGYAAYSENLNSDHVQVHLTIGGYMADITTSPLDPIFYAHHCHIDFIAFQHQLQWFADGFPRDYSYKPLNPKSELPGFPGTKLEDVIDIADLCVSYAPPSTIPEIGTLDKNVTDPSIPGNTNITDPSIAGNTNITDPSIPRKRVINSTAIELPDEWLKASFGKDANTTELREKSKQRQLAFDKKVDDGTIIVTKVVIDDKSREYVGLKKDGEKNLRELSGASSIPLGVSGFIILLTLFL